MRKSIKVLGVVLLLLSITSFVFALTNQEKLNLLEERFLKGDISEKAYYELKKKYEGRKPEVSVPISTANLLKNPSFEEDSNNDGIPDNWKSTNLSKTKMTFSLDKDTSYQGEQSVLIEFPTKGEGQWSQKIPVVGGKTYSFKCWMRCRMYRGDGCAAMVSRFLPAKGGVKEGKDWFTVGMYGSKDWTLFSKTAVAPPDAKEVEIKLRSHGMTGTIWFDDIEFSPVE